MKHAVLTLLRWYQRLTRALIAQRFPLFSWTGCRQVPTCSEYCAQQVAEHGVVVGLWEGAVRLSRCTPFIRSAY